MDLSLNRQAEFKNWLHGGLFLVVGAVVVLALGTATAFAAVGEEGEGGPPTGEPVIVPEAEAPPPPPVTVPESNPAPSASAPAPKASEPAPSSSSSGSTRTTPTHSGGSTSGGSRSAPTSVNHSVRGPSSGGSGSSSGNSTGGSSSGGSGSSSSPVETTSTSPTTTTSAPTRSLQDVAAGLASRAGQAPAKDRKDRQDAVASLGKALGTALLGKAAAVSHPMQDQAPTWVPLPGKSKLPYMLVILAVLAIAALIVWTQFRGPRESRRWKARVDHRAGSASGFTLAPGNYPGAGSRPRPLRAAEDEPERRGTPRRTPRRKAA